MREPGGGVVGCSGGRRGQGGGGLFGQVVTQLYHIWQLICCVITNKICQRSSFLAELLTRGQPASDGADLSDANRPPSRRAAPFKFNTEVSSPRGRWSATRYARSMRTADCRVCMSDFNSQFASSRQFFFSPNAGEAVCCAENSLQQSKCLVQNRGFLLARMKPGSLLAHANRGFLLAHIT